MESQTIRIQSLVTNPERYGSMEFWTEILFILEKQSKNIDELSKEIDLHKINKNKTGRVLKVPPIGKRSWDKPI